MVRFLFSLASLFFVSNGSIECRLIHGEHLDVLFEGESMAYTRSIAVISHIVFTNSHSRLVRPRFLSWIVPLLSLQHALADLSCSLVSNNEYRRRKFVKHGTTPANHSALKPPHPIVLPGIINETESIEQKINIHLYHPSVASPK